MVETGRCDHCGDPLGPGGGQRWLKTMPEYMTVHFCNDCAARLAARASERAASEDDELRIRGITATLAGEVWQSPTTLYWFRDPIVLRQRPAPTPAPPVTTTTTGVPKKARSAAKKTLKRASKAAAKPARRAPTSKRRPRKKAPASKKKRR